MTRLSVLIVNYNSGDRLSRCLACLAAQTFADFEIIVIDNESADDSLARAEASGVRARFIHAGANIGFAAANNLAAKQATGDWLVFLNPDAYARADWLEEIVAAAARYPWAEAFGSTQLKADDETKVDGAGDVFPIFGVPYRGAFGRPAAALTSEDAECFAPCAAACAYRRKTFAALGGFDEKFFCYCEDVDLGFRLRLRGGRAVQLRRAIVTHEGSGVSGRRSEFTVYQGNRNRIWLISKNMPAFFIVALFPVQIAASLVLLTKHFFMGVGPAYLRALIDGYRGHSSLNAQRRAILSERKLSLCGLAKIMTWSPVKFARREASLRPIREPKE